MTDNNMTREEFNAKWPVAMPEGFFFPANSLSLDFLTMSGHRLKCCETSKREERYWSFPIGGGGYIGILGEGTTWEEAYACLRNGVLTGMDMGCKTETPRWEFIRLAKTKEEAQRLVEQDIARREAAKGFADAANECAKPMGILEEIISPAQAERPWVEQFFKPGSPINQETIQALNHLADRQDAESSLVRALTEQVAELLSRANADAARIEALEDARIESYEQESFRACKMQGFSDRLNALEAKAKDPEPVSEPYKLPYAERLERMVCAMSQSPVFEGWAHERVVKTAAAQLKAIDTHLSQPQPAREPCGVVDWEGLSASLSRAMRAWGYHDDGLAADSSAEKFVEIFKAHLGEGGSNE